METLIKIDMTALFNDPDYKPETYYIPLGKWSQYPDIDEYSNGLNCPDKHKFVTKENSNDLRGFFYIQGAPPERIGNDRGMNQWLLAVAIEDYHTRYPDNPKGRFFNPFSWEETENTTIFVIDPEKVPRWVQQGDRGFFVDTPKLKKLKSK